MDQENFGFYCYQGRHQEHLSKLDSRCIRPCTLELFSVGLCLAVGSKRLVMKMMIMNGSLVHEIFADIWIWGDMDWGLMRRTVKQYELFDFHVYLREPTSERTMGGEFDQTRCVHTRWNMGRRKVDLHLHDCDLRTGVYQNWILDKSEQNRRPMNGIEMIGLQEGKSRFVPFEVIG